MSIKVVSLVWRYYQGGGSKLLTFLALADFCDDSGGRCFPSMATIAKKIRLSESQARRLVHTLIEIGYVAVVANTKGGSPGSSRNYKIQLNKLTPSAHATHTGSAHARGATCKDAKQPLAPIHITPSTHDTLSTIKPSIETSSDFEGFWETYPKKIDKERAKKIWFNIKPSIDLILKTLKWQVKLDEWLKDNGKYIPNPSTYLANQRWNDEPTKKVDNVADFFKREIVVKLSTEQRVARRDKLKPFLKGKV